MEDFLESLSPSLQELAAKAHINDAHQAILTPQAHLLLKDFTEEDVHALKTAAAKLLAKPTVTGLGNAYKEFLKWVQFFLYITASELSNLPYSKRYSRVSFACTALDKCTRGGILTRGITEFCGAASAGKTQLLLHLCLTVQLNDEVGGLSGGVAFICTENRFPSKRLFEMSKYFIRKFPAYEINYMANVHVEHLFESDALLKCVGERLPALMSSTCIKLIIIDSVAAVFRTYVDYVERSSDMRRLANHLLQLAYKYNSAVICVNQVATVNEDYPDVPCLGLSWAHLGRTRIRISKIPKQIRLEGSLLTVRKLEVMYSPDTPNDFAEFLITKDGIVDVPPTLK
uniref:RecA family profile 1 domain-containing protein n=1 Tax=Glossina morsitans morsitans TaxID=37546 RepID=A0A1B0GAF6_GLOMM